MKFARFEANGKVAYGIVEGDVIKQISGSPFTRYRATDQTHRLSAVRLLAPVTPSKIVAIGLNYKSHLGTRVPPKVPEPFLKVPSSLIGPGDNIVIPREAIQDKITIQEEAELTIVIGKRCKRATRENALSFVLGYTCGNDVSARQWQSGDLQWWRAKSSDTFSAVGPYIATDLNPGNLRLKARVNGKTVQEQVTSDLLHDVPAIIAFVSSVMTLEPGDVIMTGTPGQPADLHPGDTVEVDIEGIGVLKNPVVAEKAD
jgi:2-keto-4-pentenoate hydratase/2-oxohepta-3-ene-1,7-dioic acid hydratase in catechol pathway